MILVSVSPREREGFLLVRSRSVKGVLMSAIHCAWLIAVLVISQIVTATIAQPQPPPAASDDDSEDDDCALYLAPSSLGPDAGLGIYAGISYTVGDRVGQPSLGIPVTDPYSIYEAEELIAEFGWNGASVGGNGEAETVFTILPGPAMLTNFHVSLSNVLPGGLKEEPLLDRGSKDDVGAGASTSYHNFTFVAKANISAGQELFASVGEGWFNFLEQKKDIKVPTKAEYDAADKLVQSLATFREAHSNTVSDSKFLDIMLRLKTEMILDQPKLSSLVPLSLSAFRDASDKGMARSQLNERSVDWLRENGKCLDKIRPGKSAIPGAGRGAFASRPIAKGSLITPVPLVQVMDNTTFDTEPIPNQRISKRQLLINYCFGHRMASVLLCPTTSAALVNHNKEKANARIRWSDFPASEDKSSSPPYMMTLDSVDPDNMGTDVKLVFDLVATEDISEGQEIYLDYGDEWEDAWNRHAESWKKQDFSMHADYVPASAMNAEQRPILLSNDTSLKHHTYLCRLEPFAREDSIADMPVEDYNANPTMEPHSWNNFTRAMYQDNDYMWWWPCDVVDMDGDGDTRTFSTVVYQKSPPEGRDPKIIRKLKNVPPSGIKFIDLPYHSNQHLKSAFRHYIPIPDEIFPLHWRADYQTAESVHLGDKNIGKAANSEERDEMFRAYEQRVQEAKCGVYVAPSNIKGAGLGVFLGVSTPGKGFTLGSKTPIIPVVDVTSEEHWDANDYTWTANNFYAEYEAGYGGHAQLQIVNEGSMANFHPGLVNFQTSGVKYKPTLDRRTDPGAGAFSDYTDFSFTSRHEVAAGEEVYISYGESWFSSRSYLGKIPLSANYKEANRIVASLESVSNGQDTGLDESSATDLLSIVKDDNVIRNERTRGVLSSYHYFQELGKVMSRNGTAEATTEIRSPEWLEENGYCTDNIYAKQSTIDQAGLGAFARRPIAKGKVITPAPLLCTWGRHMFDVVGDHMPNTTNRVQLVYNYQYANPDSSALFFPLTTAITINHRSSRGWMGPKPNAELRWSETDKKSRYYLQRPLEDLKKEHYATMVIDFVATRDIMLNEEVTIDYGDAWDDAWNKHVREFSSPCPKDNKSPCFKSSKMVASMNDDKFNEAYHVWTDDHFTLCERESMPDTDDFVIFLVPRTNTTDTSKEVTEVDSDGHEYRWSFRGVEFDHDGFELASINGDWYPCQIIRAEEQDNTFDVVFFTYETSTVRDDANVLRRNRTLAATDLKFLNKPYMSDMHWGGAFRHEIKIPDSIYPVLWKDLLNKTSATS